MLQRLKRLFRKTPPTPAGGPRRIPASRHQLLPAAISPGARQVVGTLTAAGYQALVVGGCIRDILLGKQVKDFDVATDATPEQVKSLFRRSRIIGRRFRIVHVHVGRELIEVTTFRAGHDRANGSTASAHATEHKHHNHRGILLRDNVFGSLEEDAERRDFTINAIYYDLTGGELLDFLGGIEDLARRTLRVIGDPGVRFREDPVRMLRAARFQAKLGFQLHPATAQALAQLRHLIGEVPPARLFDELLKLLMTGHALAAYEALGSLHLLEQLLPGTAAEVATDARWDRFLRQALINTDQRIASQQRVTPAFLFAALLWPSIAAAVARESADGIAPAHLHQAAPEVIGQAFRRIAIPRRFSAAAREIWELQPRLESPSRRSAEQIVEHPRFRAAYDFLLLREQSGEELGAMGDWWTRFQNATAGERQTMLAKLQTGAKRGRPRRRRRPRAAAAAVE